VAADTSLNAGLLVCADNLVERVESLVLPITLVEVQNDSGFGKEVGSVRKDPMLILPGLDGIGIEYFPDGGATDGLV